MAAPVYGEDLTDIDMGQSTTGWSAYGGGGAGLGTGADFAIQSTLAIDKQITNADKGMLHNDATVSLGANDHVIGWIYAATPGIMDTLANHGLSMGIGTSTTAFNKYAMAGSDTLPEGGNRPWVARYSTAAPSPGAQVGTPGATPTYFGGGLNTTATAKGANLGLDAFRYGTGVYITAGDGTTPATFAGFAAQDELSANKWGLLFRQGGVFKWQGRFVVGQNTSGTPTAAHFDDSSGAVITLFDTPHSQTDFTQLIVDHASTIFNLTGATFLSLGTNNPGRIVFNNASTVASLDTCVFDKIGITTLRAGVTATGCTWKGTGQITQNGATITSCTVSGSGVGDGVAAVVSDSPSSISNNNFVFSDGHAIEITTAGTYTFTGNKFTGYGADDTNDAAVYNNSSGAVTLNIAGGGDTPTVRNGTGASTTVNNNTSITIGGIPANVEVRIYNNTGTQQVPVSGTEIDGTENSTGDFTFSAAAASSIVIVIFDTTTNPVFQGFTVPATDTTIPYSLITDRVFLNP